MIYENTAWGQTKFSENLERTQTVAMPATIIEKRDEPPFLKIQVQVKQFQPKAALPPKPAFQANKKFITGGLNQLKTKNVEKPSGYQFGSPPEEASQSGDAMNSQYNQNFGFTASD